MSETIWNQNGTSLQYDIPGGLGIIKLVRFLYGNSLKKLVSGEATYLNNFFYIFDYTILGTLILLKCTFYKNSLHEL